MTRPRTRKQPPQGAHIAGLRQAANLSQNDLARILEVPQSTVAFWEGSEKPPRSDVLPRMAKAFGVGVEDILNPGAPKRKGGPVGKVQRAFEAVSELPRTQQEKIVEVVMALVGQFQRQ